MHSLMTIKEKDIIFKSYGISIKKKYINFVFKKMNEFAIYLFKKEVV